MIHFSKYHGAGNDFIIIDNYKGNYSLPTLDFIEKVCHRRYGVGADGIIYIESSSKADFLMEYYNSDGSQSFCGNGSRCVVRHFLDLYAANKSHVTFQAYDGLHEAIIENREIGIKMANVQEGDIRAAYSLWETGSPHFVSWQQNVADIEVNKEGAKIRFDEKISENGVNVNFAEVFLGNKIKVRTYERGVEAETLSCGTGVVAVAVDFWSRRSLLGDRELELIMPGGILGVKAKVKKEGIEDIWLSGPVEQVYKGTIYV